eukprot:11807100-Ditylum_brightwellii.AAC.1
MHRKQDPHKVLAAAEREKKAKYLKPCLERRWQLTPLVFLADKMAVSEAQTAMKKMAAHLASKHKQQYSEMC